MENKLKGKNKYVILTGAQRSGEIPKAIIIIENFEISPLHPSSDGLRSK